MSKMHLCADFHARSMPSKNSYYSSIKLQWCAWGSTVSVTFDPEVDLSDDAVGRSRSTKTFARAQSRVPLMELSRVKLRRLIPCLQLVFRLATHLRRLALTCIDLRWLWSSSNSYASRRTFFTVWPPNASRHKMIASHLYMREIYDFLWLAWTCESTCESVWPAALRMKF